MKLNKFGGIPLNGQTAEHVMEAEDADKQLEQTWQQIPIEDKQNIAKTLNYDKFKAFDVEISKMSEDEHDIAIDIIDDWLLKQDDTNESVDIALYKKSYELNVDESWLKWIVGMVTLRFIWKKVTKKFKNKIMKIAGVPESLWSKFNNQDLDSLPIMYKDKVSHALTANYDGAVNESLQKELCNLFEHINEYTNESFDAHTAKSVQESYVDKTYQLLSYHFKFANEASVDDDNSNLEKAIDFARTNEYALKYMQIVRCKFGVKFEADFRTGNARKAFNELSKVQQHEFLSIIGMLDESNTCDEDVAEIFNASSIDHRTHLLSSIGVPYTDIDAMLSMEYQQLPEQIRLNIAKCITSKDEVYEKDGIIYTNAGKESVIKKLDMGKYGIANKQGKLWDATYDTLEEAADALKAYHTDESMLRRYKCSDPWNVWNDATVDMRKRYAFESGTAILDYNAKWDDLLITQHASLAAYFNKLARMGKLDESENDSTLVDKLLQSDMQYKINLWDSIKLDVRRNILKESGAKSDENDMSFDEYKKEDADKILTCIANNYSDYIIKSDDEIAYDDNDSDKETADVDETKLEDAYHNFIDTKLQEWFGKKTIGELTNDEKKIFFGRIKRTWPKKKKELGFED